MYIKINETNIYNYLTKLDIINIKNYVITKDLYEKYDIKTIILQGEYNYLNRLNNLLLLNYISYNNDKILYIINIKNIKDIKMYKKSYFNDLVKNIKYLNLDSYKMICYECRSKNNKTKTLFKYDKYSISKRINNIFYFYKLYKKYNIVYKEIVIYSAMRIKYNFYKYKYVYYILKIAYKNDYIKIIIYNYNIYYKLLYNLYFDYIIFTYIIDYIIDYIILYIIYYILCIYK